LEPLENRLLLATDLLPVAIVPDGRPLSGRVAEGEDYVLIVAGADGQMTVETAIQPIEIECLTNPANPLDVDGSGMTTPLDVLVLINALNTGSAIDGSQVYYVDVNSDLSPLDVLTVINHLNTNESVGALAAVAGAAEGEAISPLPVLPILPLSQPSSPLATASHLDHERPATTADGLDPRNTIPASQPSSPAADPSDDESLPASPELEPILSDFAADVDDVWRASA